MDNQSTAGMEKLIWVVDDDETALVSAENVLRDEGFTVMTFSDPVVALERALSKPPDLIVLDVLMPGLDGFQFCARLRAHPAGRGVPILMATALEDTNSINQAFQAGATDFTTKPLNWEIETHRLRYMLRTAEMAKELREREQETRAAKEDWERTFNSISDVVTMLSPDLKVLRANSATASVLEKPLSSIVGSHCYQLFQNAKEPCPNCPVLRTIRSGVPSTNEIAYRNPGVDCQISAAPVTDKEGRLLHVVHVARDLTEQKKLEAAYWEAQKMDAIGTLAGGVAHDFKNILLAILGFADLLESNPHLPERQRAWAGTISRAAQRGSALSSQLLTFSRKGAVRSEKRPVDFNELIRDFQKMFSQIAPKNISVQSHLAEDLTPVHASSDQLHQVLMNLGVNATQAMPEGGSLTFSTRNVHLAGEDQRLQPEMEPGEFVLLSVKDTGLGMDKQTLRRIFEPFFTTKKVGEGTGLGLSVVYGIVKEHRGCILCESDPGMGTTFKVYLPAFRQEFRPQIPSSIASPVAEAKSETILVVDDEPSLRALMEVWLGEAGYSVIPAQDGETALRQYRNAQDRIKLVLLDLGMPGMTGWECLEKLRAINPEVKVLITTGYGGTDLPMQVMEKGAAGFINKPYQWPSLHSNVRRILDAPGLPG